MENIQVRAEPQNGDLLWLQRQHRHRSYSIFTGQSAGVTIKARRCDRNLWDHIKALPNQEINEHVFQYIREAGFAGVFKTGFHKLDHGLVTTLVERWRPETHTFHFPVGEATITLQDVQVLWGLPVDGPVVSGSWDSLPTYNWVYFCDQLMGFEPEEEEINSGKIKIATLVEHLDDPLEEDEEAYQQRARMYILALIGGHLFPDSSSYEVALNFLLNIEDLSREGRKSWGSAVLAFLYRNLCNAAEDATQKGINGALNLLQIWAWDRMPHIAPTCRNGEYNFTESYASRWNYTMTFIDAPSHVVVLFRSAFTALKDGQFIWCPYDEILHLLPQDCREDSELWSYCGWMVFWSTVEPHLANRVTRQFGWIQDIPGRVLLLPPHEHRAIHDITLRGRPNTDWVERHAQYISTWNNRAERVYHGNPGVSTTPAYMRWYFERTVLSPVNPSLPQPVNRYPEWGATQHFYEEGIREVYNRAQERVERHPESQTFMQDFLNIPQQMMDFGHNQDRINYGSQNYQFPSSAYHPAPPRQPSYSPGSFYGRPHPSQPSYSPAVNPSSFYARPHPVFSTPATPVNSFVDSLFSYDMNAFNPDHHVDTRNQYSPIPMQNLGSTSQQPSSSRHARDVHLGDDDDEDDEDGEDDEPPGFQRRHRQTRRPPCGTGGHR